MTSSTPPPNNNDLKFKLLNLLARLTRRFQPLYAVWHTGHLAELSFGLHPLINILAVPSL